MRIGEIVRKCDVALVINKFWKYGVLETLNVDVVLNMEIYGENLGRMFEHRLMKV